MCMTRHSRARPAVAQLAQRVEGWFPTEIRVACDEEEHEETVPLFSASLILLPNGCFSFRSLYRHAHTLTHIHTHTPASTTHLQLKARLRLLVCHDAHTLRECVFPNRHLFSAYTPDPAHGSRQKCENLCVSVLQVLTPQLMTDRWRVPWPPVIKEENLWP